MPTTADPLDDVAFLSRSPHRVRVLEALAAGPLTRRDLHEETGISQPTLGRILGPFEERHWAERRGQAYALTPWGELLAADLRDLLDTVETVQRLGDVIRQLPAEELDFDLRALADATVTLPTAGDVFRHARRAEELLYRSQEVRNLTPTIAPGTIDEYEAQRSRFLDGSQRAEAIVATDVIVEGMDEAYLRFLRPALASDRADLYVYEGSIPFLLGVADGTVLLAPLDDHDVPTALVETANETVRAWAERRLDEYRAASTLLTLDDLPE